MPSDDRKQKNNDRFIGHKNRPHNIVEATYSLTWLSNQIKLIAN